MCRAVKGICGKLVQPDWNFAIPKRIEHTGITNEGMMIEIL